MPTYTQILQSRNNLPRRADLEERLRNIRLRRESLTTEEYCTKIEAVRELLNMYRYSVYSLTLLSKAETLPHSPGVYAILVSNVPVYIGESTDIQNRCITHAKSIVNQKTIHPYGYFLQIDSENISFKCLETSLDEIDLHDKQTRLVREGIWCNQFTQDGHLLLNTNWRNKPKPILPILTPLGEIPGVDTNKLLSKDDIAELLDSKGSIAQSLQNLQIIRQEMSLGLMLTTWYYEPNLD